MTEIQSRRELIDHAHHVWAQLTAEERQEVIAGVVTYVGKPAMPMVSFYEAVTGLKPPPGAVRNSQEKRDAQNP